MPAVAKDPNISKIEQDRLIKEMLERRIAQDNEALKNYRGSYKNSDNASSFFRNSIQNAGLNSAPKENIDKVIQERLNERLSQDVEDLINSNKIFSYSGRSITNSVDKQSENVNEMLKNLQNII